MDATLRTRHLAVLGVIRAAGHSAGSDLNRVKHGKPPRGRLVGPG